MSSFNQLFQDRALIGMIHLAGRDRYEKVSRAMEELTIYEEEGINGAIIEDYHGTPDDVLEVLKQTQGKFNLVKGINILRNPYSAFGLASKFGAGFIQFDSVQTPNLNLQQYQELRNSNPEIAVFGGVGFKYVSPTGNPLYIDLDEGRSRCEAIVTTGSGTGIETPLDKLENYRKLLGEFPLIVGAGVNFGNVREQLRITNGAIIGSYFKPNRDTQLPIQRQRVRDLVDVVRSMK